MTVCAYCCTCIGTLRYTAKPIPIVRTPGGVDCHAVCWLWMLAAEIIERTRGLPQPRGRT